MLSWGKPIELLDIECVLCHVTGVQFDRKMCPYKSGILDFLQKLPFAFISMGKPLNHIHQDTKSARLIAVCKRTFTVMMASAMAYVMA